MTFRSVVGALTLGLLAGCGANPNDSCRNLCTNSGFGPGAATVEPKELNCICGAGTGEVKADACSSMCRGLGYASSLPFRSGGAKNNACQCN